VREKKNPFIKKRFLGFLSTYLEKKLRKSPSNTSKRGTKALSVNTKIVKHCHGRPSPVLSFPQEEFPPYRCPPY
jgi:hypothetical protein